MLEDFVRRGSFLSLQHEVTASLAERLTCVPPVREVWRSNFGLVKSYTALQRFATASTTTQVAVWVILAL